MERPESVAIDSFINSIIPMMTPILFAALGGLFTRLSGLLNIGLEGLMLVSAFFSIYTANLTHNLFLGILAGIGISALLALLMGILSLNLRSNIFVVGLGTNLFANGLTVMLASLLFGSKGTIFFKDLPRLAYIEIPFIHQIPVLGPILSGYRVLDYLAVCSVFICALVLFKTPYGYHLRAVGKDTEAARNAGISVYRHRLWALIVSGVFSGLGGCALSLPLQTFVGGMTNGRGWIALVAVILGRGNPIGVFYASLIFGGASALANFLQAGLVLQTVASISPKLLMALPFLITLLFMIARKSESEEGV